MERTQQFGKQVSKYTVAEEFSNIKRFTYEQGAMITHYKDGNIGQTYQTRIILPGVSLQEGYLLANAIYSIKEKNWYKHNSGYVKPQLRLNNYKYNSIMELIYEMDRETTITIKYIDPLKDPFLIISIKEWMD